MGFWIPLAMMAAGAVAGDQKRQAEKKFNDGQSEVMRYSPWTGLNPNIKPITGSALGGAISGGVAGLQLQQGLGGDSASPTEKGTESLADLGSPQASPSPTYGVSPLGGDQMGQQLGQMGNNSPYTGFEDQNQFSSKPMNRYGLLAQRQR